MKRRQLKFKKGFHIGIGNRRSQCATMVLGPGESEGGPENYHRGADQWLFIVSGTGKAIVNGRRYALKEGGVLLIERGDRHQIQASARSTLVTLNFYVPPAYTSDEEELPAGKGAKRRSK